MVGLHDSRCPECGTGYTLDGLLAQQPFIARSPRHIEQPMFNAQNIHGGNGSS
jgi:hypothetical protein